MKPQPDNENAATAATNNFADDLINAVLLEWVDVTPPTPDM
ncbi:MAG: hypothetical protein AB7S56_02245 [Halothiobacillaceae bacterium]